MEKKHKFFPAVIVVPDAGVGTGEATQAPYLLRRLRSLSGQDRVLRILADVLYGNEDVLKVIDEINAVPVITLKGMYNESRFPKTPFMRRLHAHIMADRNAFHAEYRFRVLVECGISAFKRKFDGFVRARNPRAQLNEILFKVLAYNLDCVTNAAYKCGISIDQMFADWRDLAG